MTENDEKVCRTEQHPDSLTTQGCMCGTAGQHVGGLESGERRFFLSKGQFSLVDIAVALTHQIGPCDFQCAVWTGTQNSVDRIGQLVDSHRIREARWVLCDSQRSMNEDRLARIVEVFGIESVRVVPLHAKLMTMSNDDWSIVVQTSANMTENRAVEQFDVTDSPGLLEFVDGFFDEIFDETPTLSDQPPFDGFDYESVGERLSHLCLGEHFEPKGMDDMQPIGVSDGLV